MRLYAILVYVLLLNLVLGFVATTINGVGGEEGIFLPDAKGVVSLQTVEELNKNLEGLANATSELSEMNSSDIIGSLGVLSSVAINALAVGWSLLASLFSTLPTLICYVVGFHIPDALMAIMTSGIAILTVYSAIQIISGKWFSFVE